jgi:hypothetical protein
MVQTNADTRTDHGVRYICDLERRSPVSICFNY